MPSNLPISRLVKVDVVLAALAAQSQNLSTLLLLTSSAIIDVVERIRTYSTLAAVAADFGTSGPEYAAATLYFGQSPQPSQLKIGRWAKTAVAGKLVGAPLTATEQSIATWNAITTGSLSIGMDAQATTNVTGITFAADANMNAVASRLQVAIRAANAAFVACTVVWNAIYNRFEVTSGTTGVGSKVLFASAAGTGTDISALLKLTAASSGAYRADAIAVETALAAATLFDSQYGQSWYALLMPEGLQADHIAVAGYIEASNNKHIYGVTTQDAAALSSAATSDVAYALAQLKYNKTIVQYSSASAYAVASLLGRLLTVDYTGNSTAITLMYKQEPGVTAESLTDTQMQSLAAKFCNVFVAYNNNTSIVEQGKCASGEFIDTIVGADALSVNLMTAVYNLLYTSPTKVPQTDGGAHLLVTTCDSVLSQYVRNGFLAPGVWDQNGFGNLAMGDFLAKGFYVYATPMALQAKADRQARKAPAIQIAAKCAGAVHSVGIILNIAR
jgi:hypothetical protein